MKLAANSKKNILYVINARSSYLDLSRSRCISKCVHTLRTGFSHQSIMMPDPRGGGGSRSRQGSLGLGIDNAYSLYPSLILSQASMHPVRCSSSQAPTSNLQYCIDLVRKNDYENYLSTLLLPKEAQRAAFVLRAFNVELAQVGDTVSEKNIGLMRMQFWKDSISKIAQGSPPQAPVAVELSGACIYFKLTKRWLERMVEARTAQLHNDYLTSMSALEDYAESVNSSLYYLLLECIGIKDVQADHAASHLGKAQGIVTVLRATPFHASNRRIYLPMEVLSQHRVSHEDIIRGSTKQPVKDVVFDIASRAHQHLEKARSLKSSLPSNSNLVFLNASICDHYLQTLQKLDFNVFDGKLSHKNALLPYHMYVNKLRKRF